MKIGLLFQHPFWSSWDRSSVYGNKIFGGGYFLVLLREKGWTLIDCQTPRETASFLSAPSDINRSIRNTHTHTHTHHWLIHTSASQGQRLLLLVHLVSCFLVLKHCVYVYLTPTVANLPQTASIQNPLNLASARKHSSKNKKKML